MDQVAGMLDVLQCSNVIVTWFAHSGGVAPVMAHAKPTTRQRRVEPPKPEKRAIHDSVKEGEDRSVVITRDRRGGSAKVLGQPLGQSYSLNEAVLKDFC